MSLRAILLLTAFAFPAIAQPNPDAAQCAAYWLGRADYADISTYLTGEAEAHGMGEAFRKAALRLSDDTAKTEALIADQRPMMALLTEAYIYGGDKQSREIFERLTEGCDKLGGTLPELQSQH